MLRIPGTQRTRALPGTFTVYLSSAAKASAARIERNIPRNRLLDDFCASCLISHAELMLTNSEDIPDRYKLPGCDYTVSRN